MSIEDHSFGVGPALLVLLLGLVLLLRVPLVYASEYRIWPLFDYRTTEHGSVELDILGPLFSYARNGESSSWALRPLISVRRNARLVKTDILYPLLSYRSSPGRTRTSLAELFVDDIRTRWDKNGKGVIRSRDFQLRPFLFYREGTDRQTRLSLFPLYFDFDDFFGIRRLRGIAFPLYLEAQGDQVLRRWYPFPFLSTLKGPGSDGLRLWPLGGYTRIAGKESTHYLLWPFYVSSDRERRDGSVVRFRWFYPFHSRIDAPEFTHRGYLIPLFVPVLARTEDRRANVRTTSLFWPFLMSQEELSSGRSLTWRLFPLWQRSVRGSGERSFYAWPLLRTKTSREEGYKSSRTSSIFVLARQVRESHDSEPARARRDTSVLGLLHDTVVDGRRYGQSPALLDAVFPSNEHVETLYAPLWRLLSWQRPAPDARLQWSLLWGLWGRDGRGWRWPLSFQLSEGG